MLAWKEVDAVDFVTLITTSTINRMTVGVLFSKIFFCESAVTCADPSFSKGNGLWIS